MQKNDFGGKSHSQELRFALFNLLEVQLGHKPDNQVFLRFYHDEMIKIIESVKEKIGHSKNDTEETSQKESQEEGGTKEEGNQEE